MSTSSPTFVRSSQLLCFIFGALLYFLLRNRLDIAWNDTGYLVGRLWYLPDSMASLLTKITNGPVSEFLRTFGDISNDGYRPISALWGLYGTVLVGSGTISQTAWIAFVALVQGAAVTSVFAVALRLLGSAWAAALAAGLGMLAAPTVAAQWIVLAGCQNLVTLTVCAGLLAYFRWHDSYRWRHLVLLAIILFVAPWIREFAGILAILILWLEIGVRGRFGIIAGVAALGLLHAVYPTAFIKFLFYPDLPLSNTFSFGALGRQVLTPQSHAFATILNDIRWEAVPYSLLLVPPVIACCLGILVLLPGSPINLLDGRLRLPAWIPGVIFFAGLLVALAIDYVDTENNNAVLLWLLLGIGLAGFRIHPLLPIWFLASTLPFLKVFNQETHLLYAAVPAGMIVAGGALQLWQKASAFQPRVLARTGQAALAIVIMLAVLDQACNLYGSYRFVRELNRAQHTISQWLGKEVPAGSVIIGNALQTSDIQLYSAGHVSAYYTRAAGVGLQSLILDDAVKLNQFLSATPASTPIYLLDVDYDFTPAKIGYHSHRYLWQPVVDVDEIGRLASVSARYPFFDPIKLLVPRQYVSYLGPPDLVDDFYRGPARDGTPFMRELFAVYDLYRVTGRKAAGLMPVGAPPYFVERNYKAFDIWNWSNVFFALPFVDPIADSRVLLRVLRPQMCFGNSVDAVKARVDAGTCPTQRSTDPPIQPAREVSETPRVDIYRWDDRFIAIPKGAVFDPAALQRGDYRYGQWFAATTLGELRRRIDAVPLVANRKWLWLNRPDILERRP